jgi:hypothetical protein
MDENEFNVVQFFNNGCYEYVLRHLGPQVAVELAKHCTETIGAQLGLVERVIITDGGDFTCFEWKFGEGVTYPPREAA